MGAPIRVPVGPKTLGRIMNVIGEPIDEKGPIETDTYLSIHRDAPTFAEQGAGSDMLVTGTYIISRRFRLLLLPLPNYFY